MVRRVISAVPESSRRRPIGLIEAAEVKVEN
jgi:hypothetical protein